MKSRFAVAVLAAAVSAIAPWANADQRTLDQLLQLLNLGNKPAIQFADPDEPGGDAGPTPETVVTAPVPADFSGGAGTLNAKGGSLVALESTPLGGLPADLTTLGAQFISDILIFPPNGTSFFMFSDPFPDVFHIPTYDSNGDVTGEAFLSLSDVLSSANGRRVNTIQEGFLIDQRDNPPLGAGPVDIATNLGVPDVTIFVNRFTASTSQAYVILSDNPVPEPGSLAVFGAAVVSLVACTRRRRRHSGASDQEGLQCENQTDGTARWAELGG